MVVYSNLSELFNTTAGMEVLRNNTGSDEGSDEVVGVKWFTFDGNKVEKLYVNGNSYVGFGSNSSHLRICNRDGKIYYLYRQEGQIAATKFLKIRWEGYTKYNSTSSSYSLIWELFLFDSGDMFVNLVTVPTSSSYLGTSSLTCGDKTYTFTVKASTPVFYSFLLQDDNSFTITTDEYSAFKHFVLFGTAEIETDIVRRISSVKTSYLDWDADIPEGTSLKIYSKLSNGEYELCDKKTSIPGLSTGMDLTSETLFFKVEMTTEDACYSPVLTRIRIQIFDRDDVNCIFLTFDAGNTRSIQRAVGDITVAYDGSGSLIGEGGPVLAFEHTFTPEDLDPKNNPHNSEHISIPNIQATGISTRIYYRDANSESEHINIADVAANGLLTHVDDI